MHYSETNPIYHRLQTHSMNCKKSMKLRCCRRAQDWTVHGLLLVLLPAVTSLLVEAFHLQWNLQLKG